jgi:phosphate transport system ATP-binding protein
MKKSKVITALKVRNLNISYDTQKVLEGVSIDIYQNQVTAIIGPSGCGKSTFIRAMNRTLEMGGRVNIEGEIEFFGQNIYGNRVNIPRLRRQVGIVSQIPQLFPISIYDNIAYGVKLMGWLPKREIDLAVESSLRNAALWDEVKHKLHKSALELSGGQQQRLCIARALVVNPQVLLMDEPCSALDPISTNKIEDLIHDLRKNLAIVIVSHNLQQVARVSDYTAFFNTDSKRVGKLVEFNTTVKMFTSPVQSRTRDYITARVA